VNWGSCLSPLFTLQNSGDGEMQKKKKKKRKKKKKKKEEEEEEEEGKSRLPCAAAMSG